MNLNYSRYCDYWQLLDLSYWWWLVQISCLHSFYYFFLKLRSCIFFFILNYYSRLVHWELWHVNEKIIPGLMVKLWVCLLVIESFLILAFSYFIYMFSSLLSSMHRVWRFFQSFLKCCKHTWCSEWIWAYDITLAWFEARLVFFISFYLLFQL